MNDLTNTQKIAAFKQGLFDRGETLSDYCREHGLDYNAAMAVLRGRAKGRHGKAQKVYVALDLKPETEPQTTHPSRRVPMNEANLFPDELRVTRELDWVYTSSRKVARYFDLPHAEVMRRVVKLNEDLAALGDEVDWDIFRFGVLTHGREETPGEGGTEWLLSCDAFWLLVRHFFDDRADTQCHRRLVDKIRHIEHEMERVKTQAQAAQA